MMNKFINMATLNIKMKNESYKQLFVFTLVVTLILVLVLIYIMLVRPGFNGYVVNKQLEARDLTLIAILNQVQQQGFAQISFGNQTLLLVPYNPNQQIPGNSQQQPSAQTLEQPVG